MDTQNLENRIQRLEQWKSDRERQQIVYPLDVNSKIILNKYFLAQIGNLDFTSNSGQLFRNILVQQDNKINVISVYTQLIRYTVNTTTDILTLGADVVTGTQGTFADNDQVFINSTDTPPSPLVDSIPYYVVNSTGTTIQLSLTLGGAVIDITTAGTGVQYIYFFN